WTYSSPGGRAIQLIDGDLYIGGGFTSAGNDTNIQFIAKLAGSSTNWSRVGTNGLNGTVRVVAELGDTIYAGGDFTNANCVASWDGSKWTTINNGVSGGQLDIGTNNAAYQELAATRVDGIAARVHGISATRVFNTSCH